MKRATFITHEQIKVGAVVLFALAILGFAMYKLGQSANLFTKRYRLYAYLANASGLRQGGQVTIAGQLAGTVAKIEFLPVDADTTRNLRIELDVDRDLQPQVRGDSRARLRTMGLLGDKLIDISPGTPRYRALGDGDTIAVAPSVDYEQLLAQASSAMGDVVGLTRDLRVVTTALAKGEGTAGQLLTNRALYDQLNGTLARANGMLARLQAPNGTLGRLLDDPTLYRNLTAMVGSVDSLVRQIATNQGTLGRLLRDDTLYSNLVGITAGADTLVKQLSHGNGTAARLLTDQALYDQLVKAVTDLNAILADVRRNPGRYTKGLIKVF